jgi:nuclear GTP-binding protein
MKELRKVIDRADVVLEVLDARDPLGCRSIEMEEAIAARGGKKIVFVLNKIDLVPPEVLQPWLNYLRTFYPTVAFKASTQNQSSHLSSNFGRADKAHVNAVSGSRAVGTEALMQLLKNYCRNSHIKTAITVGVIGYPNVGKSSVINSLKRSKAASVSSTAGHTKVMQEIHIDSKIKLLDCPGIVFDHTDSNALLLRNCINTESMNDPIAAVEVILSRCEPHQIQKLYEVSGYGDVIEFLVALANEKGKLGKGGIPDRKAAARIVLQDWNRGKIPFFTPPPDQKNVILDTQIVSEWSNNFEIDTALNPTSIFLPEHAEIRPEKAPGPVTSGPKCSIQVDQKNTNITNEKTMSKTQEMKEMLASDASSDENEQMTDDEDHEDVSSTTFSIANLHTKLLENSLNPMTALIARRKAKAWRKLKRRANRQQIGEEAEKQFCARLDNIGLDSIYQAGMKMSIGLNQGFNILSPKIASSEEIDKNL